MAPDGPEIGARQVALDDERDRSSDRLERVGVGAQHERAQDVEPVPLQLLDGEHHLLERLTLVVGHERLGLDGLVPLVDVRDPGAPHQVEQLVVLGDLHAREDAEIEVEALVDEPPQQALGIRSLGGELVVHEHHVAPVAPLVLEVADDRVDVAFAIAAREHRVHDAEGAVVGTAARGLHRHQARLAPLHEQVKPRQPPIPGDQVEVRNDVELRRAGTRARSPDAVAVAARDARHLRDVTPSGQRADELDDGLITLAQDDVVAVLEACLGEVRRLRAADDDRDAEALPDVAGEAERLVRTRIQCRQAEEVRVGDARGLGRLNVFEVDAHVVSGVGEHGADQRHPVVGHDEAVAEIGELAVELHARDLLDGHDAALSLLIRRGTRQMQQRLNAIRLPSASHATSPRILMRPFAALPDPARARGRAAPHR